MAILPFSDFASVTVTSAVASTDTTISVDDETELSDSNIDSFYVVIHDASQGTAANDPDAEILSVTGKSAGSLTVTRGLGDTTAVSHPDTSVVNETPVSLDLEAISNEINDRGYNTITTQTTNYTANFNEVVLGDASGGAITITLPVPEANNVITIKKIDTTTNAVTIATPNTETIDGDSSRTLTSQYVARELTSDGSNYYVI